MNFENKNIDLFHPYIIVAMVLIFLAVAMPMWYFYGELPAPGFDLYVYIGLGLIFFILGILFGNFLINKFLLKKENNSNLSNYLKETYQNLSTDSISYFKDYFKINSLKNPEKLSLFESYSKNELIVVCLVSFGILLQVINILHLGGIPLFSAELKAKAASKIWLLSYIIFLPSINILIAKYNRKSHYLLLLLGLVLFVLTGYRTTPIAILISAFITLYYTRNIKLKHQILFVVIIALVLLAVGFIAVQAISWQHWHLNPIELVSYRAAFTLNVLRHAINSQFATRGNLFYSTLTGFFTHTDPRVLVGQATLARDHSITSTIFGPALLDFGWIGMAVQMFLIGIVLKTLHTIQKYRKEVFTAFYGILLAQTIIWIETGPTDVVVWLFYLIGIILIFYSFKSSFGGSE